MASFPLASDHLSRVINVHWNKPRRHRAFYKTYATFGWSTITGPGTGVYDGLNRVAGIFATTWIMSAGSDVSAAINDVSAHVAALAAAEPSITLTDFSGILEGPTTTAGTVAWSYTCWKWEGDGYDTRGNKIGTIPDASYTTEADVLWFGTVGFGGSVNYSHTDPGPPPIG
jgi:hypothetical protein